MSYARLVDLGRHLSSRNRARRLREELVRDLPPGLERLTVDLEGVQSLSDSFADEFFAVLALDHGEEWFRERVSIVNASKEVRAAIVRALRVRLDPASAQDPEEGYSIPPPPDELPAA